MNYLMLFLSLIIYCGTCGQTCIIVHTDTIKNKIYAGSDTKVIQNFYENGRRITKTMTIKKMGAYENIYYVVAGTGLIESIDTALKACKTAKNIKDAATIFINTRSPLFKIQMITLKSIYPLEYYSDFLNKDAAISAVFFGIENGKAKMIRVLLGIYESANGDPYVKWGANVVPDYKQHPTFALGHVDGISKIVFLDSTYEKSNIIKTIENLIRKQSKTTPNDVGLPIDLIELSPQKVKLKRIY